MWKSILKFHTKFQTFKTSEKKTLVYTSFHEYLGKKTVGVVAVCMIPSKCTKFEFLKFRKHSFFLLILERKNNRAYCSKYVISYLNVKMLRWKLNLWIKFNYYLRHKVHNFFGELSHGSYVLSLIKIEWQQTVWGLAFWRKCWRQKTWRRTTRWLSAPLTSGHSGTKKLIFFILAY